MHVQKTGELLLFRYKLGGWDFTDKHDMYCPVRKMTNERRRYSQGNKLRLILREKGLGAVKVGTVDDYQGQVCEALVLDPQ